jgi:DNA-binding transcriptional MerR regulator
VQKLRATGMPIRDVRRYFEADPAERLQILQEHRRRVVSDIEELTGALDLIDYKIDLYRKGTLACEA